jgi:hypothetical protein
MPYKKKGLESMKAPQPLSGHIAVIVFWLEQVDS